MAALSAAGLALIRALEGCVLHAYDDQDAARPPRSLAPGSVPRGRLTIGYGHTGPAVVPGLAWSPEQAEAQLERDLAAPLAAVAGAVPAGRLSANQVAALVSFAFNIGCGAFAASTAAALAAAGALAEVPAQIARWTRVRVGGEPVESAGLVGRRAAEVALWQLPDDAAIPDFRAIADAAAAAWRAGDGGA